MSPDLELHLSALATAAPGLPQAGGAGSCGSAVSESRRDWGVGMGSGAGIAPGTSPPPEHPAPVPALPSFPAASRALGSALPVFHPLLRCQWGIKCRFATDVTKRNSCLWGGVGGKDKKREKK